MELIRALGLLAEPPSPQHAQVAELLELGAPPESSEFTDLFLMQLYPYASVYLGSDGMLGGDPADRIAGFWRAVGHAPPDEPDHLSALLGLLAGLEEAHRSEPEQANRLLIGNARDTLLSDHILSWVPPYLSAVQAVGSPFYKRWAGLLSEMLGKMLASSGLGQESQSGSGYGTHSHLGSVPSLEHPSKSGGADFLSGLLAPARSGLILSRTDLARAARDLSLGSRVGERRFQLKALFSQDARSTLVWLQAEAVRWTNWHAEESWAPAQCRDHWISRSADARDLLESLAAEGWDEKE